MASRGPVGAVPGECQAGDVAMDRGAASPGQRGTAGGTGAYPRHGDQQ